MALNVCEPDVPLGKLGIRCVMAAMTLAGLFQRNCACVAPAKVIVNDAAAQMGEFTFTVDVADVHVAASRIAMAALLIVPSVNTAVALLPDACPVAVSVNVTPRSCSCTS